MKTLKRLFSLVLVVVLVASVFAGCGNDKYSKKQYTKDGKVIVKVAIPQGQTEFTEAVLGSFSKKNKDISFEYEYLVGDYTTKLITQISAGTAPDLIWINDVQSRSLAAKDCLLALDDYFDKFDFDKNDVYETILKCGQYSGKQYMIPRDYNHVVTFYDKKMFDDKGVEYPELGWTWEDFIEVAYKFPESVGSGKNKVYTKRACQPALEWGATAPIILKGLGATFLSEDGKSANFNTPGTVKALKEIKKLCDDGVFINAFYNDLGGFGYGKVAMCFQTRSNLTSILSTLDNDVNRLGVTSFPVLPECHEVGTGSSGYAVVSTTKCPDEAAKVAFYLLTKEAQIEFSKTGDCVPVLKSLAKDKTWIDSIKGVDPEPFLYKPEADVLQPSITVKNDLVSIRYDSGWTEALSALLTNVNTAEEAAKLGHNTYRKAFAAVQ